MRLRVLAFTLLVMTLSLRSLPAADGIKAGSVLFILDCSRSMAEPATLDAVAAQAVEAGADTEEATRLDVAKLALHKMLRELATDSKCQVGLWLYGHRLAWEPEVKEPELLSQDRYLEATVGYAAIGEMLPGDDVEQAQPLKRFNPQEFERIQARLEVIKPWGEKPLYLTLTRALEALADAPASGPKSIIVLTDGGNEQWLARYKTSRERVAKSLDQNIVPIHFVHFGPRPERTDRVEEELIALAEQGGGSLMHASTTTLVSVKELLSTGRKAPTTVVAKTSDVEGVEARIAEAKATLARPTERNISGSVLYYGKPVTSATITLEGTTIAPVKADRQGQFLIRKVPTGRQYRVLVKGIAKNSFREKAVALDLESEGEEQPFLAIDLGTN